MSSNFFLTLTCEDKVGIVAAVTTELAAIGANIAESNQYWDKISNRFFMRLAFSTVAPKTRDDIERALKSVADRFEMKTKLVDVGRKPKIIIMVSKFDHAMLHLLYQIRVGWLNAEVVAIVSNHDDSARTAELEGIPFHCWTVNKDNKAEQEQRLIELAAETGADLVILAR
ncbi:formyltransferase family protein, partial [Rhizobium ruizarguesonis]